MRYDEALDKFLKDRCSDWVIDNRIQLIKDAFRAGYKFGMDGTI